MSEKKEYSAEEIEQFKAKRLAEMKDNIPDLKVEAEYWSLISSIAESKHKLFIINLEKGKYAESTNSDFSNKKEDSK